MREIVRWTTPTIKITFDTIDPAEITAAYLTIKTNGSTVVSKDVTTMTVGDGFISWTLTQEECGNLAANTRAVVVCDWKLSSGTRGKSRTAVFNVVEAGKDEVI